MFMGEFQNSIDDKSRIIIPQKFRTGLGETFVMTRGYDDCLFVYAPAQWNILSDKVMKMDPMKANVRAFQRYFVSGAMDCELDKQGRVVVPVHLREHAKLEKDCVTIGTGDRVEIWDKPNYEKYIGTMQSDINSILEQLSTLD